MKPLEAFERDGTVRDRDYSRSLCYPCRLDMRGIVVQRMKDKRIREQGLSPKEVEVQQEYALRVAPEYDPSEDVINEFALCKGDKRFVGKVPQGKKARRELVEMCRKCPVKDPCLAHGHRMDAMIAGVSREGLWVGACIYGGKTPLERARIRKEAQRAEEEADDGQEVPMPKVRELV